MAVEGKVAKIMGKGEIVINRGRANGVRQGMVFEVYAPEGEEVWDPDTGDTLGTVEDVKAKAEVTEVKERLAVARLFDAASPLGDSVEVRGFGMNPQGSGDGPDLESMFGGPLEDVTKVQVGDAVREIQQRR